VKVTVPQDEEGVYLKPEMGAIVTFLNRQLADASPGDGKKPSSIEPSASAPTSLPMNAESIEPEKLSPES
jgi:hypothetical protein